MSFYRAIAIAGLAGVLAGCSEPAPEPVVQPAPQPEAVAVTVEAPAGVVVLPSGGTIPSTPPPPGAVEAANIPRDYSAPIVPGSAQDPNVLPPGFVPKPPALEYVKNGQPNLEALSEALQVYCMWKKEVPADLQDLVTSKFLPSLPPLPAGKKYAIDGQNLSVVLVN